ncbi:MAG: RagB/SusD family nutrient uptake outer membrane protein [Prevotellaceae bacterium]|jgi:hypothetical protein|nr:RagB/SusD family nutrient uptake outer membrane protein [Prevotellaceae bacterium]
MKRISKIAAAATLIFVMGCTKILEETPRNIFEPSFFATETGVIGGLTGLYASLRGVYGQPYYFNICETGTDEYTYGSQADGNFKSADLCGLGIPDASNSRFDVLWNVAYGAINSATGVIDNATEAGMDPALIAEARFFRGFYYFLLAQSFGGVPLDLGGGELKFNTTPTRLSTRNTVPEVYCKAVFPDLEQAVSDLPENPRRIGTVTKNVARLALSRAYLTFGWWLENPENIPTYPACDRKGIGSYDLAATQYFQKAYDVATEAIGNPGPYKLQDTYYDVNLAQNDRNSEIMLWADHTESSAKYNEGNVTGWDGVPSGSSDGQNQAVWMVTWYFQSVTASLNPTGFKKANSADTSDVLDNGNPFFRTVQAGQSFSRMWSRMAPPIKVFTTTFADKTKDSRFDGTFVTTYRGTWNLSNLAYKNDTLYNAVTSQPLTAGQPAVTFLTGDDTTGITYFPITNASARYKSKTVDFSGMGLGYKTGRADWVVPIDRISRTVFPGLWKLGAYRKNTTDYNDDKVASTRPYNIFKFSEFYFIAAEAAVKGATGAKSARELINVIRERAGKWKFSNAENKAKTDNYSSDLTTATPTEITISYILDERSREYFGEGYRWHDLARTQKWAEYAGEYEICAKAGDATPEKVTRDLKSLGEGHKYLYLRPIPTGQLDNMDGDAAYKDNYQNPGYN